MPFDIVAFYESQDASSGALMAGAGTNEQIYRVSGDDIYVKPRAATLAALWQLVASTPGYVEIRQPSLKIPYSFIRGEDHNSSRPDEGYHHMWGRPLPLYAGEKLNAYILQPTNEISIVVCALASGKATRAMIDEVNPTHRIRGTVDQTLTAGAWTQGSVTWSHSLEKGKYAIVGMEAATYKSSGAAVAVCRLIIPETTWRPGVVAGLMDADKAQWKNMRGVYTLGLKWPLMPEISFNHDNMPNVELLSNAANTDHWVALTLQKIG